MHVHATCKNEDDPIKNQPRKRGNTNFPTINLWGFFRGSSAANSAVGVQIRPNFKLVQAFMHVLVTCKLIKIG